MRILLLGAGGPAGVNTARALDAAGHDVLAADDNPAHHEWLTPYADVVLGRPIELGELVMAQPDPLVLWLADQDVPKFQPSKVTIQRCQDKAYASRVWFQAGIRALAPVEIEEPFPDHLHLAKDAFGLPFWLRATEGAGAKGAICARSIEEAYHWLRFWQIRKPEMRFIAEEFLPGRDIAWTGIYYRGSLVTSFARERLEYLYPQMTPEGLTGTPTIARVIHDSFVNEQASWAVEAIDALPHGIYSVDLREDANGVPRPTEINAGRGFTTLGLWSLYGPNFLDIAAHLGAGLVPESAPFYDALPEGLTLSRHIDCPAVFTEASAATRMAA